MKSINKKITNKIKKMNYKVSMGNNTSHTFLTDPVRLGFTLSRYKFVAKMFEVSKMCWKSGQEMGLKVQ